MLALLMAMSVTAAPPGLTTIAPLTLASKAALPLNSIIVGKRLNLRQSACRAGVTEAALPGATRLLRPQERAGAQVKPLGELPKANEEIAILRMVEGCDVPVVVSYSVEETGRFAPPAAGDGK
jgi:hypothetical protein